MLATANFSGDVKKKLNVGRLSETVGICSRGTLCSSKEELSCLVTAAFEAAAAGFGCSMASTLA